MIRVLLAEDQAMVRGAFVEGRGGKSAYVILVELEKRWGYCDYLEQRGTISESGVDEAENVRQFIE